MNYEELRPEALGERPDVEYLHRVQALHDFEDMLWERVDNKHLTAMEAEEAYWAFVAYVEGEQ